MTLDWIAVPITLASVLLYGRRRVAAAASLGIVSGSLWIIWALLEPEPVFSLVVINLVIGSMHVLNLGSEMLVLLKAGGGEQIED